MSVRYYQRRHFLWSRCFLPRFPLDFLPPAVVVAVAAAVVAVVAAARESAAQSLPVLLQPVPLKLPRYRETPESLLRILPQTSVLPILLPFSHCRHFPHR